MSLAAVATSPAMEAVASDSADLRAEPPCPAASGASQVPPLAPPLRLLLYALFKTRPAELRGQPGASQGSSPFVPGNRR